MNIANRALFSWLAVAALCAKFSATPAQETHAEPAPQTAAEPPAAADKPADETDQSTTDITADIRSKHRHGWHSDRNSDHGNEIVSIGEDATLEAGKRADAVVAIMGDVTSAGEVADSVAAIMGDARVTGTVGDGVVAMLGDSYIDSRIGGDAVSVLGDIELGPHAEIGGQVVTVGGDVKRDPAAIVHGGVKNVLSFPSQNLQGLRAWIDHCARYGRLLAFEPHLGWAWGLALGFLAFYVLLALMFRDGVERCARTLQTHPGHSILAALLTVLLTPVLFVLLLITVVGIAVVPFISCALFCAMLFGKAALLAWLGGRVTRLFGNGPIAHPAFAVLIGGLIVLALYLVPGAGFIIYNLVGLLGLGMVVYTLILISSSRKQAQTVSPAAGAPVTPPPSETRESASSADAAAQANTPSPSTPEPAPLIDALSLPRAGFWVRMGALLLDVILVALLLGLIEHDPGKPVLLALAVYGAVMWKLKGSTVGGIVCGLQVVRLDGRAIDWPTSIVRALGCFLSLAVAGLGFFWIAFDPERQAWHDKIAGTVVVRSRKTASLV